MTTSVKNNCAPSIRPLPAAKCRNKETERSRCRQENKKSLPLSLKSTRGLRLYSTGSDCDADSRACWRAPVRCWAPLSPNEPPGDAEARLVDFHTNTDLRWTRRLGFLMRGVCRALEVRCRDLKD